MRTTQNNTSAQSLVERLESRQLLAASPVALNGGTLMVRGTDGDDTIVVSLDAVDASKISVTYNAQSFTFDLASVKRIHVKGKVGNDSISVDETAGAVSRRMHVVGGVGNDSVTAGSGNDQLIGGAGDDVMTGGAGNDKMVGANGNDVLTGGDGDDKMNGNDGDDKLVGGAGADRLRGGEGGDDLDGGDGEDRLNGGEGNDDFVGTDAAEEVMDLSAEDEGDNVLV